MSAKDYQVSEVARIAGVTVRTLHHYDAIGLLVPSGRTEAGYRHYGEEDLYRLQQILVWRELGFPLEQIRRMLDEPDLDRREALLSQRRELVERARRTQAMVRSLDRALEALKGGRNVDVTKLFAGFDPARYEDEVRERWGGTGAYQEAARRTERYKEKDWARLKAEGDEILSKLAEKMREGKSAQDEDVRALAESHRLHIDRWFYPCSREMHSGLAEMYIADERFTARIDEHGPGLAEFLAEAIAANAARG